VIPGPRNHPDRPIHCEEALEPFFRALADTEPAAHWNGDESEFWPLRRDARKAGWEPDEIDRALLSLAFNFRQARIEKAKTDAEVMIAKMLNAHRRK